MALRARLAHAVAAGRAAVAAAERPGSAAALPGFAALDPAADPAAVLDALGAVRRDGAPALLLTASDALALYRIEGTVTEHVPRHDPGDAAAELYAARRLALACRKWRVMSLRPLDAWSADAVAAFAVLVPDLPPGAGAAPAFARRPWLWEIARTRARIEQSG